MQPQPIRNYVNRLGQALGLNQQTIQAITTEFGRFNDTQRFRIMEATNPLLAQLEQVDNQLKVLIQPGGLLHPYAAQIQNSWDAMNDQLARLQVLSLIQRKESCDGVIRALLDALNQKIQTVNQILNQNLDQQAQGGVAQVPAGRIMTLEEQAQFARNQPLNFVQAGGYQEKYLKYKNKYLSLKKMI